MHLHLAASKTGGCRFESCRPCTIAEDGKKSHLSRKRYGKLSAVAIVAVCFSLQAASGGSARARPRADLVERKVSASLSTVAPGGSFGINDLVANRGNATSRASTTRFFLGNVAIGARHVPALKKGKTSPGSVSVVVPAGTANGAYPVRACADASKNVTESNERNNCRVANGRVAVLAPVKPPPPPPPTVLDSDGDGSLDNVDCAPHDPSIHPGAPDKPDLKFVDSNCDGIDGTAAKAIFVSPIGDDAAAGTMAQPKRTLAAAVGAAQGKDVYATFGIYTEALNIVSGVSVYGGYDVSWKRSLAQATRITGATTASGDTVGAVAVNIAAPTTLQLVTLAPSAPTSSGRSSYGLRGIGSRGLLIEHVSILAAPGAPGAGGSNGVSGKSGGDGIGGGVGGPSTAGSPGTSPVGHPGGHGGLGGSGVRSGANGKPGESQVADVYGRMGGPGGPGGGAPCCNPRNGGRGYNGDTGVFRGDGAGGALVNIATSSGFWVSSSFGQPGGSGSDGHGGGGGGGGAREGGFCLFCNDGGRGGGGGGGGQGGGGGGGGRGGGASFGIFLENSVGAIVRDSTVTASSGGAGGTAAVGAPSAAGAERAGAERAPGAERTPGAPAAWAEPAGVAETAAVAPADRASPSSGSPARPHPEPPSTMRAVASEALAGWAPETAAAAAPTE